VPNPLFRPAIAVVVGCPGCEAAFVYSCGTNGCISDNAEPLLAAAESESEIEIETYWFGYSVDSSIGANRVAVSSLGSPLLLGSGLVRVWQLAERSESAISYQPLGDPIVPEMEQIDENRTQLVLSIALSGRGDILAIASGDTSGFMKIQAHQWNGTSWLPMGDRILGSFCPSPTNDYKKLVALSTSGDRLATVIGGVGVSVFEWSSPFRGWRLLGNHSLGTAKDAPRCQLDSTVAMSAEGDIVAVARFGTSRINAFRWSGPYSGWIKIGDGVDAPVDSRTSLSLTSAGDTLAVTARVPDNRTGSWTNTASFYTLLNDRCQGKGGLLHFSYVASGRTTWSLVDRSTDILLNEGGPHRGFERTTVVEELCLSQRLCAFLSILNADGYIAFWNGQEIAKTFSGLNMTVGDC